MTAKTAREGLLPAKVTLAWLGCIMFIGALALAGLVFGKAPGIADVFFREQDLPAALAIAFFLFALRLAPIGWFRTQAVAARVGAVRPKTVIAVAVAFAAVVAVVGWCCVMRGYPLSTDEFMASFDAAIFREGRLFATVPDEWRFVRGPIQPQFMLFAPDGRSWASTYLPTNAMALALFGRLAHPSLAGAFWAGLAIVATYGVGRRMWPERPQAALLAAVLLATSTQLLVTAMTPYSMTAHLALNMAWLWLFMRDERRSDAAALVVAFVACGLHQVVFHPIFAAAFILELWLARRWPRALLFTAAYGAIGLFWLFYWKIALPGGPEVAAGGGELGLAIWITRVHTVLNNLRLTSLGYMAANLFRFVTWQNPLLPALTVLGFVPAIRAKGYLRPMALSAILMLLTIAAIMPYQGHGWGYRYLHGFLGVICLIGALAWMRLADAMSLEQKRGASVAFALAALFSLVVLLPLRSAQANSFIRPYARAEEAIRHAPADVVVVDATDMFFAADLVRNDPFLRNSPKVVDLLILRDEQIRELCSRYRVVVFDRGSRAGIRPTAYPARNLRRMAENRALMRSLSCGTERILVR